MKEEEWLNGGQRTVMMKWLRRRGTKRQFYLAGCAAVRRFWEQLPEQPYRHLIGLVERYADGLVSREQLSRAYRSAETRAHEEYMELHSRGLRPRTITRRLAPVFAAVHGSNPEGAWEASISAMSALDGAGGRAETWAKQCAILRDIFVNPFQPAPIVDRCWLAWQDATVLKIAQLTYNERAFDRMPILADALEEAGCTNPDILSHCRSGGEHVRGCWVVDLLLGKE